MTLVSFYARVAGTEKVADIDQSGSSYLVHWEGAAQQAHHLRQAVEIAAHHIGEHLRQAWGRHKLPWGLRVVVKGRGSVVYGDYPRLPGPGVGGVIGRIRKEGEPDATPMAALRNAITIIKVWLGLA